MIKTAVIVATAFAPNHTTLIQDRPRAMLPALGKPIVARVMDRLYQAGIRHYVVLVGMDDGTVAAYLGKQWVPDARLEFVLKPPQETFSQILAQLAGRINEPFILTSYNNFTHPQFTTTMLQAHQKESAEATLLTSADQSLNRESRLPSIVQNADGTYQFERDQTGRGQPVLGQIAICGMGFIQHLQALKPYSARQDFISMVESYLSRDGHQARFMRTAWLLQVEDDYDLLLLNRRLLDDTNDTHILSELPNTTRIIPPVRIDPRVSIGRDAVIGPYVYIEQGGSIGYGARVSHAIVLDRGVVPSGATIKDAIVSRQGTRQFPF